MNQPVSEITNLLAAVGNATIAVVIVKDPVISPPAAARLSLTNVGGNQNNYYICYYFSFRSEQKRN